MISGQFSGYCRLTKKVNFVLHMLHAKFLRVKPGLCWMLMKRLIVDYGGGCY